MLNTYLKHVTYNLFLGCSFTDIIRRCVDYMDVGSVLLQISALFLFICSFVFDLGMYVAMSRGCLLQISVFRLMCFVPTMCVMFFEFVDVMRFLMSCVFIVFVSSVVYVLRCVYAFRWLQRGVYEYS